MPAQREPDPSLFHEPHGHAEERPDEETARNARYGLRLFGVYVLLYAGFIALAVFRPDLMRRSTLGGINLAIFYGIGLIAAALILAVVYMALCRYSAAAGRRARR